MIVLDTNILIRYFTQDNEILSELSLAIVNQIARGERQVVLKEGVIAEIVFVLSSKRTYNLDRPLIRTHLSNVLRLQGILASDKEIYLNAHDYYVEYPRLSFVDALCVAHALNDGEATVLSFDTGFRNIPGLNWLEA